MKRSLVVLLLCAVALSSAENGARLLVITTDALYSSVLPLAQWKQACGISTRVVKLSAIGSDTGSIHNYIKNAYNTWSVRPENVLLAGSPDNLPSAYYDAWPFTYSTDNNYMDMSGDFRAELPVGRFPARTTAQLDVMVAKTLAYERTPYMADSLWYRRFTTAVRENSDSDDTIYWNDVHHDAALAAAAGWTLSDSLSSNRGNTRNDIVTSINAGRAIVMYRGDAVGNWYSPFDVNPASTANGNRLPIILSATCATATLTPGESMVGEAWVKTGTVSALKGAVAFIGNTHSDNDVARVRSSVARGYFDGMFTDHLPTLGKLLLRAKTQLYTEHPSSTNDYRGFSLLGDPSLRVWTAVPRRLNVVHPATVLPAPETVEVTVGTGGTPVEGALVCLSMAQDTLVYSYGYTSSSGLVRLAVSPTDTGRLRIVVTGTNLYPYDTVIPVVLTATAEPGMPAAPSRATLTASPAIFRGTTSFGWDSPLPVATTLAISDCSGRLVRELDVRSSIVGRRSLAWNGSDSHGNRVLPGVYFAALVSRQDCVSARVKIVKLN